MLHRAFFFEFSYDTGNRRCLLSDGDIDALDASATLVDHRVDSKGGLAGLAVTDNQFALTASDWHHRVN